MQINVHNHRTYQSEDVQPKYNSSLKMKDYCIDVLNWVAGYSMISIPEDACLKFKINGLPENQSLTFDDDARYVLAV